MDLEEAQLEAEEAMEKAVDYLKNELRGIRTGRASTALVEFVKIEAYGGTSDLRQLASISVPEPTQILVKPYDASLTQTIAKNLQAAGLGLSPQVEGKQIRLNLPPMTAQTRQQMVNKVKQLGEQAKVTVRNTRREANKHIDQASKDKSLSLSEDDVSQAKDEIQDLLKKHEARIDDMIEAKAKEITEI
jgi:ribosome recycling factor